MEMATPIRVDVPGRSCGSPSDCVAREDVVEVHAEVKRGPRRAMRGGPHGARAARWGAREGP